MKRLAVALMLIIISLVALYVVRPDMLSTILGRTEGGFAGTKEQQIIARTVDESEPLKEILKRVNVTEPERFVNVTRLNARHYVVFFTKPFDVNVTLRIVKVRSNVSEIYFIHSNFTATAIVRSNLTLPGTVEVIEGDATFMKLNVTHYIYRLFKEGDIISVKINDCIGIMIFNVEVEVVTINEER